VVQRSQPDDRTRPRLDASDDWPGADGSGADGSGAGRTGDVLAGRSPDGERSSEQALSEAGASWVPVFVRRLSGVAGAGLAGWLVDVGLLWTGHEVLGLAAPVAAALGFLSAGLVNFLLNRIVFSGATARTHRQAMRYALLFGINLPVVSASVPLLADAIDAAAPALPASLVVAKILVTAALLPLNTWAYGAWVFED
jgi:putative flippase GtrA